MQEGERDVSDQGAGYDRVRVLVETAERAFRGYIHKPVREPAYRLSDHLNEHDKDFVCLSEVQVVERGQAYRVGDKRDFVAVSKSAITYVTPLRDGDV
jgi:hypothetical protein